MLSLSREQQKDFEWESAPDGDLCAKNAKKNFFFSLHCFILSQIISTAGTNPRQDSIIYFNFGPAEVKAFE